MQHTFTLRFRLHKVGKGLDDTIENLGAAGCDDAVAGSGTPGQLALEFTREAKSTEEAVLSAITDVRSVMPNAELIDMPGQANQMSGTGYPRA